MEIEEGRKGRKEARAGQGRESRGVAGAGADKTLGER